MDFYEKQIISLMKQYPIWLSSATISTEVDISNKTVIKHLRELSREKIVDLLLFDRKVKLYKLSAAH